MKKCKGALILRVALMLAGAVLLMLTLVFPEEREEHVNLNMPNKDKTEALVAGDTAEQLLGAAGKLTELKMATTNNRDTKGMTAHMAVIRGEEILIEQDFPLAKGNQGKVNMKLRPEPALILDGSERVVLTMGGEGSAKIYGQSGGSGATVNGTAVEVGLCVQMTLVSDRVSLGAGYLAILLMVLAAMPVLPVGKTSKAGKTNKGGKRA